MAVEFIVTRELLLKLDDWVNRIAAKIARPVRVSRTSGFEWQYEEKSGRVLMIAKAVRIASGLHAAMLLVDAGHPTEAAALLRLTSDFCHEIKAICEGMIKGEFTTAQQKLIDDFFSDFPQSPDDLEAAGKRRFVPREDLLKSQVRLANEADVDGEELRRLVRFISAGYDGYVHGAYPTAMEMYHGGHHRFLTQGTSWEPSLCSARAAVATKLDEAIGTLLFVTLVAGDQGLKTELREAGKRIQSSGEESLSRCRGTSA